MTIFILRLAVTIICLGLVIVIHEWGHFLVARALGVRVERFTVGFGPEIFGRTFGATRYAVCAVPLGGMVKLAGEFQDERSNKPDEFFSQAWYRRVAIALAGPVMNYLLAFILFAVVAGAWGVMQPSTEPIVGDMIQGLPAAQSTLQINDRILKIQGKPVKTWDDMATAIHDNPDHPIVFDVERPGTTAEPATHLTVSLTPKRDAQRGVGLIGIMPKIDRVKPGFAGSITSSVRDIKTWTMQPLQYLTQKIRHFEGPKELSGPLGIAQMMTKATKEGFAYVIYLIAIISTGLGLFNLFPIPVLDGGHVFLYTMEGILRRPLSRQVLQVANTIGFAIVMSIFLYATYQDILRLHGGFWK